MSEQDASRVANAVRAFYGLASTAAGDAVEHAPSLLERRAG